MTQEEAMGLGKDRRKVDLNEEYYVCLFELCVCWGGYTTLNSHQNGDRGHWEEFANAIMRNIEISSERS